MNDEKEYKQYCVREGKYGLEIYCCDSGGTWDAAVAKLINK